MGVKESASSADYGAKSSWESRRIYIVLELFVRGSLVLCDAGMRVLYRSVSFEFATNYVPVGEIYNFSQAGMTCLMNDAIEKTKEIDIVQKTSDTGSVNLATASGNKTQADPPPEKVKKKKKKKD